MRTGELDWISGVFLMCFEMLSWGKSLIPLECKAYWTPRFRVPSSPARVVYEALLTFMVLQYNEVYREMLLVIFQMVSAET